MKGYTFWFTGLSSSGKTTIATKVKERLNDQNIPVILLDGDVVRKHISSDLGYTKSERDQHIKRVADICELITNNGVINIACVISPTKEIREYARKRIKNFSEIYVKCSLETCKKRDVKGYYKRYEQGFLNNFVGLNIPYEEPEDPELTLDTEKNSIEYCVEKLLLHIKEESDI